MAYKFVPEPNAASIVTAFRSLEEAGLRITIERSSAAPMSALPFLALGQGSAAWTGATASLAFGRSG